MVLLQDVLKVSVWSCILFHLGVFAGTLGPTLLDLERLFQASLLEMSNLFLILATTEGVGCLFSVAVLKFLNSSLVFIMCMVLQGASIVMFAMTSHLYVAFLVTGVIGLLSSCCFNCVLYLCSKEFATSSVIMHGVTISSSLGAIIAPLVAEPFLELQDRPLLDISVSWSNDSFQKHTFSPQPRVEISIGANTSTDSGKTESLYEPYANDALKYDFRNSTLRAVQSNVHILYIILGLMHMPTVFGAVSLFVLERRHVSIKDDYANMEKQEPMHRLTTIVLYICLLSAYMSTGGLPFAYGRYLSVYGVESHLHLSAQRMAMMTSIFWMVFTLGRILGTILSLYMRQTVLIYVCLTGVMAAAVSVMFLTPVGEVWLWIGSMSIGLFSAPLLAALLSWCSTFITLTPIVLGICSFGDLTGIFILQYFTGQAMGHFGLNWFLYFIIFLSVFEFAMVVILTVFSHYLKQNRE